MKTMLVMMSLLMLVSCGKNNKSGNSSKTNTFANTQMQAMGLDSTGSGVAFWQEGNRLTLNCERQGVISNQARFTYLEKIKAFTRQYQTAQFTFGSRVLNSNQMYTFANIASQKLQTIPVYSSCTEDFELASY